MKVSNKTMTKEQWKKEVGTANKTIVEEMFSTYPNNTVLKSSEILKAIIQYEGGLGSIWTIKAALEIAYDIEYENDEDIWY